uniref:Uncharacterized protein n=1 Tax=Parastrongyloides trichosuri TaxID=131310 RepID=A0A0N4ZS84_PARTI
MFSKFISITLLFATLFGGSDALSCLIGYSKNDERILEFQTCPSQTKHCIMFNDSPQNPPGRIFSCDDMNICEKNGVFDSVPEFIEREEYIRYVLPTLEREVNSTRILRKLWISDSIDAFMKKQGNPISSENEIFVNDISKSMKNFYCCDTEYCQCKNYKDCLF